MDDNLVMAIVGMFIIAVGFLAEDVRGAMPGASPGVPVPLRMRGIMVGFGLWMSVLGTYRYMYW